jgi:hypothetical protein
MPSLPVEGQADAMQPGPFVPPPVVSSQQVRPPLWWFGVAGGLAVFGIIAAIALWVLGVARMTDRVDDFARIDVPGTATVGIDEAGGYSIYHEYFGAGDDFFSSRPSVTVTDPSGDEVVLRPYGTDVSYDFGGHEGVGIYTFEAEQPGDYEVTADGESTSVVAVGRGIGRGIVSAVVGGFVVGGIGVVGGGIIAIVTGVRRSRSRRMIAAQWRQAPGPPGWPGAPGGWGAPPGAGWSPPPSPQAWPGPQGPGPPNS